MANASEGTVTPATPQPSTPAARITAAAAALDAAITPAAPESTPIDPAAAVPTPEASKAPAQDKESQQRFAALTKKEKALREQQKEIKAAQDQLAKEREELAAYRREREEAKRNPEGIAKQLWGNDWYTHLTDYTLNGGKPTPELIAASVDEKLEAFKKQTEAERTAQAEQERQRIEGERQQVIEDFRAETRDFVKTNGNLYELTVLHGAENLVHEVIEENFTRTGKIMTASEAADLVEKYLDQQIEKSLATKKYQAKAQPQPKEDVKRIDSAQPRHTISNNMTVSSPSLNTRAKDDAERMKRAMAKLERSKD